MRDFSHKIYAALLRTLQERGYVFRCFGELSEVSTAADTPVVLLRHDVDRMPGRSLKLALLEADEGIRSTYFFRTKPISFDPDIMRRIVALGHEVGFHYESLSDADGDADRAWDMFQNDLQRFSPVCEVKSIAMHGRPFSPWDNRDLWKHFDYHSVGITTEAYQDIDWSRYLYFTDTGRRWDSDNNLRDHVGGSDASVDSHDIRWTRDLIRLVGERAPDIVISTHPERWSPGIPGWLQVYFTDMAINGVKKALRLYRGSGR